MRHFCAVLFLILLLVTVSGYHIFIRLQIAEAKQEMKKNLRHFPDHLLTTFVFGPNEKNEVVWHEKDEFSIDGKMFDVVEKIPSGDQLIVRCISDTNESALVAAFKKLHKSTSDASSSHTLLKLLSVVYYQSAAAPSNFPQQKLREFCSGLQRSYCSVCRAISTPPPRTST